MPSAIQMPSIPEQIGMFQLVEQALIEDDDVGSRRDLPYGAVEFGRRDRAETTARAARA